MELELVWKEDGALFLDAKRVTLLESIQKYGSLSKAARQCGMSYKAAWDTLQTLSRLAGCKLFSTQSGGVGGGGTTLTKEAQNYIQRYKHYSAKLSWERLQTEALNTLLVRIERIKRKSGEDVIWGRFAKYSIKARMAPGSADGLGLSEGDEALFLFKAYGCKGDENCMEGLLLESGKKGVKVLVEDESVWITRYRLKGSSVHFCIDPKSIVVAKVER